MHVCAQDCGTHRTESGALFISFFFSAITQRTQETHVRKSPKKRRDEKRNAHAKCNDELFRFFRCFYSALFWFLVLSLSVFFFLSALYPNGIVLDTIRLIALISLLNFYSCTSIGGSFILDRLSRILNLHLHLCIGLTDASAVATVTATAAHSHGDKMILTTLILFC